MSLSTHQFPDVYKALEVDLRGRGCVKLDTEQMRVRVSNLLESVGATVYVANDQKKFWTKGVVGDSTAHATLLYGLLKPAHEWRDHVDAVLAAWTQSR